MGEIRELKKPVSGSVIEVAEGVNKYATEGKISGIACSMVMTDGSIISWFSQGNAGAYTMLGAIEALKDDFKHTNIHRGDI